MRMSPIIMSKNRLNQKHIYLQKKINHEAS